MASPKKQQKKKKKLSAEMITAISAVFIGVCAIGISLYETSLIRQAQKGSVWPALGGGYSYNQDGFSYLFENAGVGPAIIEYIVLTVDGEPVENWSQFFDKLGIDIGNYLVTQASGRIISPQSRVDILSIPPQENIDEFARQQSRVDVEVCFCSVYDDCWVITMTERAKEVANCNTDGRLVFIN
jgi:hypothetical protein